MVLQDLKLLERQTVFENVAFAMRVIGRPEGQIDQRTREVIAGVGLAGREGAYPSELSGGERQRVAIARAMVNDPIIILADEPTGNLDLVTAEGILRTLDAANSRGATVVIATHNEEVVKRRSHRVIYLDRGRVRVDTCRSLSEGGPV